MTGWLSFHAGPDPQHEEPTQRGSLPPACLALIDRRRGADLYDIARSRGFLDHPLYEVHLSMLRPSNAQIVSWFVRDLCRVFLGG